MRTTRIISAFMAFALTALLSLAITSGPSAAAEPDARAKPRHIGFASGKEIGDTNKFVTYGKWETYKGRYIKVQRKNCGTCAWKFYKKTRTDADTGKFRTGIAPGKRGTRICYRVVVPSTKKYRTTRVKVGCIVTS